ncbi:MAG: hypothetical protein JO150_10700 [Acidobacteriaceae bacterium]|nr:hypothetical protein [Acidobacteriaceae bacterium]
MFPAVPVGTVINTRDRTMWGTDYPLNNYAACMTPSGPPTYSQSLSPLLSPITWNGLAGWSSPSLIEMQSLIAGWTGSDPNAWLTAQTQAVAFDSPLSPGFADFMNVLEGAARVSFGRAHSPVVTTLTTAISIPCIT